MDQNKNKIITTLTHPFHGIAPPSTVDAFRYDTVFPHNNLASTTSFLTTVSHRNRTVYCRNSAKPEQPLPPPPLLLSPINSTVLGHPPGPRDQPPSSRTYPPPPHWPRAAQAAPPNHRPPSPPQNATVLHHFYSPDPNTHSRSRCPAIPQIPDSAAKCSGVQPCRSPTSTPAPCRSSIGPFQHYCCVQSRGAAYWFCGINIRATITWPAPNLCAAR